MGARLHHEVALSQRAPRPMMKAKALSICVILMTGMVHGAVSHPAPQKSAQPQTTLHVPHIDEAATPDLHADGELDDPIWFHPLLARTGAFLDVRRNGYGTGQMARPYSDARMAWGREQLYLALYAADEDIRTAGPNADSFRVTF